MRCVVVRNIKTFKKTFLKVGKHRRRDVRRNGRKAPWDPECLIIVSIHLVFKFALPSSPASVVVQGRELEPR